ncbi:MAG TPA: hypothetical protein VN881_06275 [Candidatus Acidoferrales bacterium]|nr:hypothetical protein [Candidatus Acidoferrales bacterium]
MSSRKMIVGTFAVAMLLVLVAVYSRKSTYNIHIPKVLTYPTTTLAFSARSFIPGAPSVAADKIRVTFDNPDWAASVSEARFLTSTGGTYFKFTCQASSTPCLQATRGSGSYTYSLLPSTLPAPSTRGTYAMVWDVNPPGDTVTDTVVMPEPTVLFMLGPGLVGLFGLRRWSSRLRPRD